MKTCLMDTEVLLANKVGSEKKFRRLETGRADLEGGAVWQAVVLLRLHCLHLTGAKANETGTLLDLTYNLKLCCRVQVGAFLAQ